MVKTIGSKQTPTMAEAIKESAWQQIADKGAAALSLRAIARELHITAPAIYNYFSRRDDLVTALIVDAFISLGVSQSESICEIPEQDLVARVTSLGYAYREWALTYPERYQLIFGTPVPGYEAPAEITVPAAAGSLVPLISTLQACSQVGRLCLENLAPMSPDLLSMLEEWSAFMGGIDQEVLYIALVVWSRVHGLVSLEIGRQFPAYITDPGEIYRREITSLEIQYLCG